MQNAGHQSFDAIFRRSAGRAVKVIDLAGAAPAQDPTATATKLVHLHRPGVCLKVDVVGLYLNPAKNAVVLCVDERPHIQVLERAQGWDSSANGRR